MQDTEKINYDNYPLLFDGRLMGYDTETQGFEYLYEMLPYFVTTEIIEKRRDWSEFGAYLDYNYYRYKNPHEFLKFFYDGFYPLYLHGVKYEPIHDSTNMVTLSLVTDYVINWLAEKMESTTVNNDTEKGLVIRGMYETLRPPQTPTDPPVENKPNNRTIEKNKKYLDITTMYYTLKEEGKKVNEAKKLTLSKSKIKEDTFKRALRNNRDILRTKEYINDFKWLIIN